MPTKRTKRAAAKPAARRTLGLTKGRVKDLPAGARRSDAVKGGAVKRVWTAGNDQPQ
jgi:hypothetical protein